MVNWQLSVSNKKTIAKGYDFILQDDDYFDESKVEKLSTLLQLYADSFYHCLGLLDIDYSISKWKYFGYDVTVV